MWSTCQLKFNVSRPPHMRNFPIGDHSTATLPTGYSGSQMEPVVILMDRDFTSEAVGQQGSLDLRNISDDSWKAVVSCCVASELRLYHLTLRSLVGIDRLRTTFRLGIVWANKLANVAPIFQMSWLQSLSLSDLPQLRSIEGIEALQNLTEVHLSGNLGALHPPLRLESVSSISKLPRLERLELLNLRLESDDISFVASAFPNLRTLMLSNEFDRAQFAYLAKKLNAQLEKPISACAKLNISCRECGGALYRFTGRRMPVLCTLCDRDRFERLLRQFDELMEAG